MSCLLFFCACWLLVFGALLLGLGFPVAAAGVACVGAVLVAGLLEAS